MPEPWPGRRPISIIGIRLAAPAEPWGQLRRRRACNTAVRGLRGVSLSGILGWRDRGLYPLARGCRAPRRIMPEPWARAAADFYFRNSVGGAGRAMGSASPTAGLQHRGEGWWPLGFLFAFLARARGRRLGQRFRSGRRRRGAMGTFRREPIETAGRGVNRTDAQFGEGASTSFFPSGQRKKIPELVHKSTTRSRQLSATGPSRHLP